MRRNLVLATLLLIAVLCIQYAAVAPPPYAPVVFYAQIVKRPLPSIPEPVLKGSNLKVVVKASENAGEWSAYIVSKYYGKFTLEYISSSFNKNEKIWTVYFRLPDEVPKGLYDLVLEFKDGEKKKVEEPHSVWVLESWPKKLRLLAFADTKTPGGAIYFYEAIKTINLLNPDLAIFIGDLVERPTSSSGWKLFLGSFLMLECPCYVVIGNHEYDYGWVAETYESIMGPQNYSVTMGDFLIIALPTGSDGWIPKKYLQWAESILATTKCKVKILAFHHPLFSPEWKDVLTQVVKITNESDFDHIKKYLYPSWRDHIEEARYLFTLVIKYDVRLILSEHIHTDLNVVIEDSQGHRHYFICPAAVAYDVREKDIRGFKFITIYANGTVDESTLYYAASGLFKYPNSIPIDLGEGIKPYKVGTIEYYYAPANDGKHYAVSFRAKNELKQAFYNIRIVFKLPKDKPLSKYRWYPYTPNYTVIEAEDCYYIVLHNVTLPPESVVKFTVAAVEDKEPPKVTISKQLKFEDSWTLVTVKAEDHGWGVDEVEVKYSLDGKTWHEPSLMDLVDPEFSKVVYIVWIPESKENIEKAGVLYIKAKATDFAGNSNETTLEIVLAKPELKLSVTAPKKVEKGKMDKIVIVVNNVGDGVARNVIVELVTAENIEVEATKYIFGNIDPKGSKQIEVKIEGVKAGTAVIKVKAYADNYPEISETLTIEVVQPPEIFTPAVIAVFVIVVVAAIAIIILRKRKK